MLLCLPCSPLSPSALRRPTNAIATSATHHAQSPAATKRGLRPCDRTVRPKADYRREHQPTTGTTSGCHLVVQLFRSELLAPITPKQCVADRRPCLYSETRSYALSPTNWEAVKDR